MIVPIQHITSLEDFYRHLYQIYRLESVRFTSNGKEYRIAFLSYDISKCQDIVEELTSHQLIPSFVDIDPDELQDALKGVQFSQPLSIENYIVYPIGQGKSILAKDDLGFQRKMKALGYAELPHVICKTGNRYTMRYPERFIHQLYNSRMQ